MKTILSTLLTLALGTSFLGAAERAPQKPINLNTATATELMQLPRVGAKTAERILAWRKQHGSFQRPEDLMNVKGIGEKGFLKLKPHVLVSVPARTPGK